MTGMLIRLRVVAGFGLGLLLRLRKQAVPAANLAKHLTPLQFLHGVAQVGEFLAGPEALELRLAGLRPTAG